MKPRLILPIILAVFVAGCAQTYWAFPMGKTQSDFAVDLNSCQSVSPDPVVCLSSKGYRQISHEEMIAINKKAEEDASKPTNFVGFEQKSGDLYFGEVKAQVGAKKAAIDMKSLSTNKSCSGYAELTKAVPGGKGSMGVAELLCNDGGKITAEFVYETMRSGFGRGIDTFKGIYHFKFGGFSLDEKALREDFEKLKDAPQLRKGNSA